MTDFEKKEFCRIETEVAFLLGYIALLDFCGCMPFKATDVIINSLHSLKSFLEKQKECFQ